MVNVYAKKQRDLTRLIGRRMAKLRKKYGFTQESLARATHHELNFNTISVLERGLGDPKISTLNEIACALNIPLSELLDIENPSISFEQNDLVQKGCLILQKLNSDSLALAVAQLEALNRFSNQEK